ncbi:3-ketoacyl-CoA thiolase, mitochondrial isoform X4 [Leptinotarsa decemlineata]|uniref:3-ketoacyl-CoA thiolase, mitochondrial isoform X4 n=1 Tax=Leptinotarsa decemlineata TaxID=7539 RepID=UPI003D306045
MTSLVKGIFIVGAKRTPFGTFGGKLARTHITELQTIVSKAALAAANVKPEFVDTVVIGNVLPSVAPDGILLPRHVLLHCGIPIEKPAFAVNRLCGSGFQAIVNGVQDISTGVADIALTGGVENMSAAPYMIRDIRFGGIPLGKSPVLEDAFWESSLDTFCGLRMPLTAEKLGGQYNLTKEEVDQFAFNSQQRWKKAQEEGKFKDEIEPVPVKEKKETMNFEIDEHPRPWTTMEGLGKLPTIFKENGLVTAGSASINEAFGAQTVSCAKELNLDMSKLNVNGGAIALGHPLAASGARITAHLVYELRRRKAKLGIGSACIGGGQGIAVMVEVI